MKLWVEGPKLPLRFYNSMLITVMDVLSIAVVFRYFGRTPGSIPGIPRISNEFSQ